MGIEKIRNTITSILKARGAEYVAVFGSLARGEARPNSDVDVLVRFNKDISLLDHIGIAYELEDAIGRKVDLVTERSLSKYAVPSVKNDLLVLYGQGKRPDLL